jgi:hypothetical protein
MVEKQFAAAPWQTVLVVVLSLLLIPVVMLCMTRFPNPVDEGIIVFGAVQVGAGGLPHTDFYVLYGPAQFYIVGALFKVFGQSFLVDRAWDACIRVMTAVVVHSILQRFIPSIFAALVAAVCLIWLIYFVINYPGYPTFPSLLMALLCVRALLPVFDDLVGKPPRTSLLSAGLATGACTLFRYDVGFFNFASVTVVLVCAWISEGKGSLRRLTSISWYWAGVAIIILPWAMLYLSVGAIHNFVHDIIVYPTTYYPRMRKLPFPSLKTITPYMLAVYLPVPVWLASIGYLARGQYGARRWVVILLTLLSAAFYLRGIVRPGPGHMSMAIITAIAVLPLLIPRGDAKHVDRVPVIVLPLGAPVLFMLAVVSHSKGHNNVALAAASTACVMIMVFLPLLPASQTILGWTHYILFEMALTGTLVATWAIREPVRYNLQTNLIALHAPETWATSSPGDMATTGSCLPPPELARLACLFLTSNEIYAILFVQQNTYPNEPIFVGAGRHDKIFANNIAFYFIAGRPSATHWYTFDPGVQTRADVQQEMVRELQEGHTRVVVLDSSADEVTEPNESAQSSGVTILDDFIRTRYQEVAHFGSISVMALRPLSVAQ